MALPVRIFTDANKQREFQCVICMCCISQCYSTSCGHLFCMPCIMKHVSASDSDNENLNNNNINNGQCPTCNRILQVGDIFPAPYVDQKINEQIIRCIYYHKGCLWTGTVSDLRRKHGHLKQCGYALYNCKYCKEKIIRNQMVKHQNEECKSNFMVCPFSIYGCSFECRIREMEKHCQVNELKHCKLKLDYLENQLFVPEIIKLNGMSGYNNQYIESNGKYYLINKSNKNNARNNNSLKPITYKKNGGYTLEFNQEESIWHLRSFYYGLIAYGINNNNNNNNMSVKSNNNILMNNNYIWNVYFQHGDKNSLRIDKSVYIESIQLSDGMSKWNLNQDTNTEEINGEFDMYENNVIDVKNKEGFIINKYNKNNKQSNWYNIIFGTYFGVDENEKSKKLELIGMITLTGIAVYYLWSKYFNGFGKSHTVPTVAVLQSLKTKSLLIPKNMLG